ncbi:MAG: carboxypeptidase-like regulatory domain-containing protein [Planctomycetota bacterium]|jgi:hypothetical protein
MNSKAILSLLAIGIGLGACSPGSGNPQSSFNVMVEASGFASGSVSRVDFAPIIRRDITLPASVTLSGTVTDDGGSPMNNVAVSFRGSSRMSAFATTSTDAFGDYSVMLPAGIWIAELDSGVANLGTLTSGPFTLFASGPGTRDYQFAAPVAVSGSVFELGGPGVAGAQVVYTGVNTGATANLTGDGVGFYSTTLVPDTYQVEVTPAGASANTHLKELFPSVTINAATTRDFSLEPGVQVSGEVLNDLGIPLLESTEIEVILPASSNFFAPTPVTANPVDGSYSIGPVPPGILDFEMKAPNDSGFPRQRISANVVGPTSQILDQPLLPGVVLSGTILQEDGFTPEMNVTVTAVPLDGSLSPVDGLSDAAGLYEMSLFPGTHRFEFTPTVANLQLPEAREYAVGGSPLLDVTLTAGAMVQGTVTDGGSPEADVLVEIPGVMGASDVTDGAGDYSFLAPLGTSNLNLVAQSGALLGVVFDQFEALAVTSPGPVNQNIALSPATIGSTVVAGTVFEPDGVTPVVGAEVVARDNGDGEIIGKTTSGVGGSYILVLR